MATNPLRHLESLSLWLLVLATVSGVYVFFAYPLSPWEAYRAVAAWAGVNGFLRSVHRYSSDWLMVTVVLHGLQMALEGKFRRWVEWVSGLLLLGALWVVGVTGLMLVWDEQAQLLGLLSVRLLVGSGLFEPGIARIFFATHPEALGGVFRILLFVHIFLTLLLLGGIWLHTVRLARPRLVPPRALLLWSTTLVAAMALLFPVESGQQLSAHILPVEALLDPWYGVGFLLLRILSPTMVCVVLGVVGGGLLLLPFLERRRWRQYPQIDRERCDACQQCVLDCPYGALQMREWEGKVVAELSPARCVECGICVASCPERGIVSAGVPDLPAVRPGSVLLLLCSGMPLPGELRRDPFVVVSVPCVGSVHADGVQEWLRHGWVAVVHCQRCVYRFGADWLRLRYSGRRRPRLRPGQIRRLFIAAFSPSVWGELQRWVQSARKETVHGEALPLSRE
ncbi:Menaquinol-cytochrome c reductase cytochrome b subunit [bacterium HR21]|nr:Menaquinol-cytochrome c reductase cytochrome b subunit [bacterium HR21]